MAKWNLIIDVALCENCHNCTLAVKDEHVGNDFPGYAAPMQRHQKNLIEIERTVRGSGHQVDVAYLPRMCNHCDDAPCVRAGQADGSVRKRGDGIVIIDPVKAKGRRDLVESCPYGAISWNEELSLPQIWIFDAHLIDQGWKEPRAAQVCPTRAITALKAQDDQMAARASATALRTLRPELNTKPRVYYKNLHRIDSCFVAGTVLSESNGEIACVTGAEVVLWQGNRRHATMRSDSFGDFKFDGLERAAADFRVTVSHPHCGNGEREAHLDGGSLSVTIMLSA